MRVISSELAAHLKGGATTLARCWKVKRRTGEVLGFTDHDRDLTFEGLVFKANTGLDAAAVQQTSGLSVDNSQAVGALSDLGLKDEDIRAGFYDGAEVLAWLVNWRDVSSRILQFRGTMGEIRRSGGVFEAELRGLSETLNQPQGRAYHRKCSAVLGDNACGIDVLAAGYSSEIAVETTMTPAAFRFAGLTDFDERWFEKGVLRVLSGPATGTFGIIRKDRFSDGAREIELWQDLPKAAQVGDLVRLEVGCDKHRDTCRLKFHNLLNYRGFPFIPGEDWALSYPSGSGVNDGGSLS